MKVLVNKKEEQYQEITLQSSFLGIKRTRTYRKVNNEIFRYFGNCNYRKLGIVMQLEIGPYFKLPACKE